MALELINGFLNWFSTTGAVAISQFGLLGIFITAIILNATFFFGIPMELLLVAFYYASKIDPAVIAIIAGIGAAIGEMIIYCIGRKSTWLSEKFEKCKSKLLQKARKEINAKGPIAVFMLYVLPLPIDFVGLFSGIMKMNRLKFFIAALAGKIARYYLLIVFVAWGISIISRLLGI
jgi:membrane protein YqaA with SNARE-associated domain